MLRVTDVLTRNLITAAIKHDKEITTSRRTNYDILSGCMVKNLLTAVKSCGVTFEIRADKTATMGFDFTSLMGKEKMKLLDDLPQRLEGCQPEEFCSIVQKIWKVKKFATVAS